MISSIFKHWRAETVITGFQNNERTRSSFLQVYRVTGDTIRQALVAVDDMYEQQCRAMALLDPRLTINGIRLEGVAERVEYDDLD